MASNPVPVPPEVGFLSDLDSRAASLEGRVQGIANLLQSTRERLVGSPRAQDAKGCSGLQAGPPRPGGMLGYLHIRIDAIEDTLRIIEADLADLGSL